MGIAPGGRRAADRHVRWRHPDEGSATVSQTEWDPADGSEAEGWTALDVLAGRPIPRG